MDPLKLNMPLRRFFRRRRFKTFLEDYQSCQTILDVGGEHPTWLLIGRRHGITLLILAAPNNCNDFDCVLAWGCELPFPDKSFDLVFSNSVIEHVGTEENQFRFAREMMRVGKQIYCQTPSRLFPIDPHLGAFFLHWLPSSWLTPAFLRYFTLHGLMWKQPYKYDVTWISKRRLKKLFPGCKIRTERFLFLPKSFIVTN